MQKNFKVEVSRTKYSLFFCIGFALAIFLNSCKPDSEVFEENFTGNLGFSTDTVLFDTLFSEVGSITKRLYVRNPSEKAINIDRIELAKGSQSQYTTYINGFDRVLHENVRLLGNDSLLVLVEVLIDPMDQDLPFLVRDSLVFTINSRRQDVKLVAWGQDANFLEDSVLACDVTWTAERPYVIYNSVLVDTLCQLTIEPGTKIFSAGNSYIFAKGSIHAIGSPESRIEFTNDRLDPPFNQTPGQWGGIVLLEGSNTNIFEYATIRNAEFGIRLGAPDEDTIPDVFMEGVIIENMSQAGILSFTSDIYAINTLVNTCKDYTIGHFAGGNYTYLNCTFGNFPVFFSRSEPQAVFSDNVVLSNDELLVSDLNVTFANNIVYGTLSEELLISITGEVDVQLLFERNLLKTENAELDINGNILNVDPRFKNPFDFNFQLDTLSPAKDSALVIGNAIDLLGVERDSLPDLGAYERIEE